MNYSINHEPLGLPEMDAQHAYLYSLFDRIEPAGKTGDNDIMKILLLEIEGYLLQERGSSAFWTILTPHALTRPRYGSSSPAGFPNTLKSAIPNTLSGLKNAGKIFPCLEADLKLQKRFSAIDTSIKTEYIKHIIVYQLNKQYFCACFPYGEDRSYENCTGHYRAYWQHAARED